MEEPTLSPSRSIPVYWAIKQCPMLSGDVVLVDWYVHISSHGSFRDGLAS